MYVATDCQFDEIAFYTVVPQTSCGTSNDDSPKPLTLFILVIFARTYAKEANLDAYTLIIVVLTVAVVMTMERFYRAKRSSESPSTSRRASYREEAFSEIMKINDESKKLGAMDSLTGLPGRQIYDERLKRILTHSREFNQIFSVMILNLDQFTSINQIYGDDFANKLLAEAANRLRTVLRQIDTVSRYAGDNFFFILPELSNPEVAVLVAQRIQDSIIQAFNIEGHRIFVTACIGVSICELSCSDPNEIVKNAKDALMKAKLSGRNTYRIYDNGEFGKDEKQDTLTADFHDPSFLSKMSMYYQPYVDLYYPDKKLIQAIPYYNHPENGLIAFNDFFNEADEAGKMLQIGEWQLAQVTEQLKRWQGQSYNPNKLLITIPSSLLENELFIGKVTDIISQSVVNKNQVIFDIAESNAKINNLALRKVLERIQDLGISVAISILAVGRLALHNVSEFPINYLKIDDKLVKGLMLNPDNEAIVVALIAIANNKEITIMAESVDFENQKNKLLELGCSVMKGKLFSVPMLGDDVAARGLEKKTPEALV
jgi:diguanylate cyclase (GGDEF)-like protein